MQTFTDVSFMRSWAPNRLRGACIDCIAVAVGSDTCIEGQRLGVASCFLCLSILSVPFCCCLIWLPWPVWQRRWRSLCSVLRPRTTLEGASLNLPPSVSSTLRRKCCWPWQLSARTSFQGAPTGTRPVPECSAYSLELSGLKQAFLQLQTWTSHSSNRFSAFCLEVHTFLAPCILVGLRDPVATFCAAVARNTLTLWGVGSTESQDQAPVLRSPESTEQRPEQQHLWRQSVVAVTSHRKETISGLRSPVAQAYSLPIPWLSSTCCTWMKWWPSVWVSREKTDINELLCSGSGLCVPSDLS